MKVSFKVNKGNTFWDFGYCPLNRGCPINTGFTVVLVFNLSLTDDFPCLNKDLHTYIHIACVAGGIV